MAAVVRYPRRQSTRKAIIFGVFLLMPIILNFFSPYVIIDGAAQGIINGSFVLFGLLFLSSLFLGRLWCAWVCPAAGLQEACFSMNGRPARWQVELDQVGHLAALDRPDCGRGLLGGWLPCGEPAPSDRDRDLS